MNSGEMKLYHVILTLLRSCRHAEATYGAASAEAADNDLKFLFSSYCLQRAKFAREILDLADEAGWQYLKELGSSSAGEGGDSGGNSDVLPRPSRAILGECADIEEAALAAYHAALETEGLSAPLHTLLDRQAAEIAGSRERIRELQELAEPA